MRKAHIVYLSGMVIFALLMQGGMAYAQINMVDGAIQSSPSTEVSQTAAPNGQVTIDYLNDGQLPPGQTVPAPKLLPAPRLLQQPQPFRPQSPAGRNHPAPNGRVTIDYLNNGLRNQSSLPDTASLPTPPLIAAPMPAVTNAAYNAAQHPPAPFPGMPAGSGNGTLTISQMDDGQVDSDYFPEALTQVSAVFATPTSENGTLPDGSISIDYMNRGEASGVNHITPSVSEFDDRGPAFRTPGHTYPTLGKGPAEEWGAFAEMGFLPGENRAISVGNLFVPLVQDGKSMLYADIRGMADDGSNYEGNFGGGFRTIVDESWIWGVYAWYDRRHTQNNNDFHGTTFGTEFITTDYQAHFNMYIPEGGFQDSLAPATAGIEDGFIFVFKEREKALQGFDGEIGFRLKAWGRNDDAELRAAVGGYYFFANREGFPTIEGLNARLEFRMYDIHWLGDGSRLVMGIENRYDDLRKNQISGILRIRIPLGEKNYVHNPLMRHMQDLPIRDVDIVVANGRFRERAKDFHTGNVFGPVQTITATANDVIADTVAAAPEGATIILDGSGGDFNVTDNANLKTGQSILGGGNSFLVCGTQTGQVATFTVPGAAPTVINNTNAFDPFVVQNVSNVHISGLNLQTTDGNAVPIFLDNGDNTVIQNTTIIANEDGIAVRNGSDGNFILNNNITINGGGNNALDIDSSDNTFIDGGTFITNGNNGIVVDINNANNLTVQNLIIQSNGNIAGQTGAHGIEITGSDTALLSNLNIEAQRGDGITLTNSNNIFLDTLVINTVATGPGVPDNVDGDGLSINGGTNISLNSTLFGTGGGLGGVANIDLRVIDIAGAPTGLSGLGNIANNFAVLENGNSGDGSGFEFFRVNGSPFAGLVGN